MTSSSPSLETLTTAELGRLFPIELVAYNPAWRDLFAAEKALLQTTLGMEQALRLEHFGSTAIEGLIAKPIVDILVEIQPLTEQRKTQLITQMKSIGYYAIWRMDDPVPYLNFVKGYTPQGYQGEVFHVHMAERSHALWDRLFFRDFLRAHPELAQAYADLKQGLAEEFRFDREAYTAGKTDFVQTITARAKQAYAHLHA